MPPSPRRGDAFDDGPWPRMKAERAGRGSAPDRQRDPRRTPTSSSRARSPTSACRSRRCGASPRARPQNFDYYAGVVTELHGRAFQVGDEFLNYTIRKPVGVAGLIMPWNAPLMLSTWRIAPALAAGNTVVLKPAEWSPLTATLLAPRARAKRALPPGVFNVVHGFGETAGAPLSRHPGVDLICFTGETTTGQAIIAAGAPTLKRSSVELGGKSPVVVFEDADPELCVDAALAQIFTHERPALHGGLAAARPGAAVRARSSTRSPSGRANIRVGDPFDPRTELGPLIHPEHHERVLGYIASARDAGRARAGRRRAPGPPAETATSWRRP